MQPSVRELGELIALDDGETRAGLKLRFLHSASIAGRALDPHGDPAPNIAVTLLKPSRNLGERVLARYRSSETNDRGEYRFEGVEPGQYYLHAEQHFERGGAQPLVQQFLAGARESKDATVLTIHGGENLEGVDFHMTSEPEVRIRGRITGLPDNLRHMQGMELMSWSADEYVEHFTGLNQTTKAPDYAFNFDLKPGRYGLDASINIEGTLWTATRFVDTAQASDDVVLALSPPQDVKGKLQIEGAGAPAASTFNLLLTRRGFGPRVTANVGSDGTFALKRVPPGEWLLNINPLSPGAFVKTARLGDQDIRFARMEIRPGSDDVLSIVVSLNSAQIYGEVDAGAGDSKRAGILLAPTSQYSALTRFYYDVTADDSGKFELKNIAPGKYKIFALEKLAPAEFRTPEAAGQLDPLGDEIELKEGARLEVHPKLIPVERAREALP